MEYKGCSDQFFGHISFAQCGEDMALMNIFGLAGIRNPTYLDIGGHHPWNGSNTALLYIRGSHGVVVDANPDVIEQYRSERPRDTVINFGVGGKKGAMPFYRVDSWSGRNSFSKSTFDEFLNVSPQFKQQDVLNIEVVTLNELVTEYFHGSYPDFLSIDAEGLDFEILEAADFSVSRPKVICAETVAGAAEVEKAEQSFKNLSSLLEGRGFIRYSRTMANGIYVTRELAAAIS